MTSILAVTDLSELARLAVVQRSALALVIASIGLPLVGVLMIGLDIIPVRFAVMHTALFGIALGLVVGVDPTVSAVVVSAVAATALAPLADRPGGLAGPMGLLMTLAIASALLLLSISGVNATGAFELLWGSILATRPVDVLLLLSVTAATTTFVVVRRESIALLLFDRETAICSGIRVGALTAVCLALTAVAVASSIRLTGALLVDAVTLLPAIAARNVATSFVSMLRWAVAIGVSANAVGFVMALWFDQPPGPVLVMTVAAITLASYSPIVGRTQPNPRGPLH